MENEEFQDVKEGEDAIDSLLELDSDEDAEIVADELEPLVEEDPIETDDEEEEDEVEDDLFAESFEDVDNF